MKGDFSRLRFNPSRHYTSVVQQQGRVALDADANEQCAINEHLRDTEAVDIIGPFGGPSGNNEGFAISISGNTLQIGSGRYYVHGILCENEALLGYTSQPYLIHPSLTDAQMLAELTSGGASAIRVWLEVWQRLVTALDDPCLREAALGQADTTARVQTVWRVVAEPDVTAKPTVPRNALTAFIDPELAGSLARATAAAPVVATQDCCTQMYQPSSLKQQTGAMMAQTTGESSDCSCEPTPAAGYRGLENQLYRVEIHHGGDEKTATFKWSRENGSVVAALTSFSGSQVFVDSLGPDANLGFAAAQWVELSDDTCQFGGVPNQSGGLFQVKNVTPEQLSLTMTTPVVGIDTTKNARVRRWEQSGASAGSSGVPLSTQTWVNLENGIQVKFAPGQYQSGDHWLIPARTASGQIDWPPCESNGAPAQPPHSVPVYRAPLACIHLDTATGQLRVDDCRRTFPALTDLAPSTAGPALHVTKLNWANDDFLTFDQLLANGLQIALDAQATGQIDSGAFQVTWEVPAVNTTGIEHRAVEAGLAPIVWRTAMPLDGQVTVKGQLISWAIPFATGPNAQSIHLPTILEMNALLLQGTSYASFVRVRVRLMGDMIFSGNTGSQVFLDGQCSGRPGKRADGTTRTDLSLPSSNNQTSSDFESWFYLAPMLTILSLVVQPAAITFGPASGPPPKPEATITLNYAPIADTQLTLSVVTPPGGPLVVSVPSQVTVLRGKTTATFPVTVNDTLRSVPVMYGIVASLQTAIGPLFPQQANLQITGTQVIQ